MILQVLYSQILSENIDSRFFTCHRVDTKVSLRDEAENEAISGKSEFPSFTILILLVGLTY